MEGRRAKPAVAFLAVVVVMAIMATVCAVPSPWGRDRGRGSKPLSRVCLYARDILLRGTYPCPAFRA